MDGTTAIRYWEQNAENWTMLARAGYDTARDGFNTPSFLRMLPRVDGLEGLDIGCGEGGNTRSLARLGARMTAIDASSTFIRHAREAEEREPLGVRFLEASATDLPFPAERFDFCSSFMCLMDLPEQERALAEAYRVLKPGGFLQFSITHPCFQTRKFRWLHDEQGEREGLVVGDYFDPRWGEVEEWTFGAAPEELKQRLEKFKVPRFDRTLSDWLNLLLDAGFTLERVCEPAPSEEAVAETPRLRSARLIAFFLILRGRKAAA